MSQPQYLEVRTNITNRAADITKHWQPRQALGKALVISDDTSALRQQLHQHWQHRIHALQSERDQAVASDELLRLTHRIIRMQEAAICDKLPQEEPSGSMFCVHPNDIPDCMRGEYYSLYVTAPLTQAQSRQLLSIVPTYSLVACYTPYQAVFQQLELQSRKELDKSVAQQWETVRSFLQDLHIDIDNLAHPSDTRTDYINEVLDILIDNRYVSDFLHMAHQFKAIRQFAQPSDITNTERRQYDTLIVLARQVQALTPTAFGEQFHASIDDPMFFLNDPARTLTQALFAANNAAYPMSENVLWHSAVQCVAS